MKPCTVFALPCLYLALGTFYFLSTGGPLLGQEREIGLMDRIQVVRFQVLMLRETAADLKTIYGFEKDPIRASLIENACQKGWVLLDEWEGSKKAKQVAEKDSGPPDTIKKLAEDLGVVSREWLVIMERKWKEEINLETKVKKLKQEYGDVATKVIRELGGDLDNAGGLDTLENMKAVYEKQIRVLNQVDASPDECWSWRKDLLYFGINKNLGDEKSLSQVMPLVDMAKQVAECENIIDQLGNGDAHQARRMLSKIVDDMLSARYFELSELGNRMNISQIIRDVRCGDPGQQGRVMLEKLMDEQISSLAGNENKQGADELQRSKGTRIFHFYDLAKEIYICLASENKAISGWEEKFNKSLGPLKLKLLKVGLNDAGRWKDGGGAPGSSSREDYIVPDTYRFKILGETRYLPGPEEMGLKNYYFPIGDEFDCIMDFNVEGKRLSTILRFSAAIDGIEIDLPCQWPENRIYIPICGKTSGLIGWIFEKKPLSKIEYGQLLLDKNPKSMYIRPLIKDLAVLFQGGIGDDPGDIIKERKDLLEHFDGRSDKDAIVVLEDDNAIRARNIFRRSDVKRNEDTRLEVFNLPTEDMINLLKRFLMDQNSLPDLLKNDDGISILSNGEDKTAKRFVIYPAMKVER